MRPAPSQSGDLSNALTSVRSRLIVALDLPSGREALKMAERLRTHVGLFKIGSELFTAEGPALVRQLASGGQGIFLDLKFHDIPNTVRSAAREAARLGVAMFNVHASGGRKMMEAAVEGALEGAAVGKRPLVLAVTVLTSLDAGDLREIGLAGTPEDVVRRFATLAQTAGLDGVVASAREAEAIRAACGPGFVIVTPGIRPAESLVNDQARVATPAKAIHAGADYLVVGRPITAASTPESAADAIVAEMDEAFQAIPGDFTRTGENDRI